MQIIWAGILHCQDLKGGTGYVMVVELSMQYCGQILQDSFETNKTILKCIFSKFDRKVDFQNNLFWWTRFENRFFNY